MNYQPNNNEAEQYVIGALLHKSDVIASILDMVNAENFGSFTHKAMFSAMVTLHETGRAIDLFTVAELISQNGGDDCTAYAGELIRNTPSAANIVSYARSVANKAKEREMLNALNLSIMAITSGDGLTQDKMHQVIANVNAVDPDSNDSEHKSKHVREIGVNWVNTYEDRIENPNSKGTTLGVSDLDEIIGLRGTQGGDVVVIAGRPKMGKSLLSVKIADHIALDLQKPVVNFSMEMTNQLNYERILTQETGISNESFYRSMGDDEYGRISESMIRLNKSEYWIDDRPNLTFQQLRTEARKLSKLYGGYKGLGGIFIDYFTLLDLGDNVKNAAFEYANLSKSITSLSKELGCPIFLLAQLNRDCEKRADKRPMPSDLGDTGQLERDASLIIMLYRDEVYNPDTELKGLTELIISVNRNGSTGTCYQTMINGRFGDIGKSEIGRMIADEEYNQSKKSTEKGWG